VPSLDYECVEFIREVSARLQNGAKVAIHCRMGIGRASLLAASILALNGIDVEAAFSAIAQARGCPVPDTLEQKQWVEKFARTYDTVVSSSGLWVNDGESPPAASLQ
jgi:protein-tyrosine phosphatase